MQQLATAGLTLSVNHLAKSLISWNPGGMNARASSGSRHGHELPAQLLGQPTRAHKVTV